jgi:beta-lactamase regulating signal transducer with metallopeptidase domain
MTLIADIPASTALLAQLANPAARALALGVIVALGLAVFRVKSTSLRLFTWTAVLYSALALPLLGWMLPPLPISAPAFLQNAFLQHPAGAPSKLHLGGVFVGNQKAEQSVPKAAGPMELSTPIAANAQAKGRQETLSVAADPATSPSILSHIEWNTIASAIYLAVAFLLLVRFFVGLALGHRLLLRSHRIDEPRLTVRLASRAKAAGLAIVPLTAESEFISVPLTMGALRSTILLPCDWREWDHAKLDAVLAHEVSHVARRDALTQRLSLLHRAMFWFSPLAWWLDRHLADLAEQASDEAALACGADRKTYARTLLEFFEALQTAPGRVRWQGVSMAKAGQAEQRIERILSWKGSVAMQLKKSITVAVVAFAIPVVYLAASVHPAKARAQSPAPAQTQAPASSAPAATAKPAPAPDASPEAEPTIAPNGGVAGTISGGPTAPPMPPPPQGGVAGGVVGPAPVAPVGPIPPIGPVAQVAPVPPSESSHRGFSYHYGFDDEDRFVIVSGKTDSFAMSGTGQDARHVEKLRKNIQGDFIWFQRDEKSYVIRDQATIDRARKFWDPQEELGKKQEALGKQQEALGKQQEELAAKMQQIRVNVPDMTAELEKLKAELKQLSFGATVEQVGHLQSEIGELQSKIGNIQSHAGDQQGKIGEEMGALGAKQGKLGEQQGELGRQQGELWREASRQMKQLLDEALAKGLAQPEL